MKPSVGAAAPDDIKVGAVQPELGRNRLNVFILLATYAFILCYLLVRLTERYLSGGEAWQQGDWLISNVAGLVRRGISGSTFIWISDNFDVDLLFVVVATQFFLVAVFMAVVLKKSIEVGVSDRLLFLLLSPAFVGFYVNDFQGAFRKEAIALVAFLPLLYASNHSLKNYLMAATSVLLFCISVFAHEANVLILPFLLTGFLLVALATKYYWVWGISAAISFIAALGAFAFAIRFSAVDDVTLLCQAVVERGLDPEICDGAIFFVSNALADTTQFVVWLLQSQNQTQFIQSYMLAFVPVFLMLKGLDQRYRIFLFVCASTVIFLPLYFVTIDWGRWIFTHISAITLILIISARHGFLSGFRKALPLKGYVVMLFFCSAWGISHVGGGLRGGYPVSAERVVKWGISTYLGIEVNTTGNVGFN